MIMYGILHISAGIPCDVLAIRYANGARSNFVIGYAPKREGRLVRMEENIHPFGNVHSGRSFVSLGLNARLRNPEH